MLQAYNWPMEVNNTLEITLNEVKFERDETKKCAGRIEQAS
jgi:hypothetical protein